MVKLFSVAEMLALERSADRSGLTYPRMMENAGASIAKEIELAYSHFNNKSILALVGSGNNGGDALVALALLSKKGWETAAYFVKERDEPDPLITSVRDAGGAIVRGSDDQGFVQLRNYLETCPVLLDGVLGTGIKLPLRDEVASALDYVRNYLVLNPKMAHVVAVDCPSGVDCDSGAAAPEVIKAELTITLAGVKQGLLKFPAAELTGVIHIGSIGNIENLPEYLANTKEVIQKEDIQSLLPARPLNSHKGTFGTAYIIAGSTSYTGAAYLAGMAAYRIGAGLVTCAVPASIHNSLAGKFPEATWVTLPDEQGFISSKAAGSALQATNRATAILIGPGLGNEITTEAFLKSFLKSLNPQGIPNKVSNSRKLSSNPEKFGFHNIVIDADGLRHLSHFENWYRLIPPKTVLTPHPGEMSALTGLTLEEIQNSRMEVAQSYAIRWGHIIVLKGAFTIIASPDGAISMVPVATPALARAGTGDVLAGMIVGLLAQGVDPYPAACSAAWIHANAGLKAAEILSGTASVLASDVLNAVPMVLASLSERI